LPSPFLDRPIGSKVEGSFAWSRPGLISKLTSSCRNFRLGTMYSNYILILELCEFILQCKRAAEGKLDSSHFKDGILVKDYNKTTKKIMLLAT
jgi:hypothetical protein